MNLHFSILTPEVLYRIPITTTEHELLKTGGQSFCGSLGANVPFVVPTNKSCMVWQVSLAWYVSSSHSSSSPFAHYPSTNCIITYLLISCSRPLSLKFINIYECIFCFFIWTSVFFMLYIHSYWHNFVHLFPFPFIHER